MPERSGPRGIDPRGPRFAAAITAGLLAIDVVLGLVGIATARTSGWFAHQSLSDQSFGGQTWAVSAASVGDRVRDPAFLLLLVIALLFAWGLAWPRTAPWGALYRARVQPRLRAPRELEDPRPPRFAQGVGLLVTSTGLALHLLGVPWALPVAAAAAFVAAVLNAVFGLCLGCQLYLLLQRTGLVGRRRSATA